MYRGWKKTEWFTDVFAKELEEMNEIMESMIRNLGKEPGVHGFSMMVGPDGIPHIEYFGNAGRASAESMDDGVREPFTSSTLDEKTNELNITADMPGVQKEEIKINATEDEVIISTEGSGRKYYKSIKPKSMIDQDSARARYNNGVLEVTFKLKEAQKGKTVKIE